MYETRGTKGISLVEILIVIGVVAILALALYPLIESTYANWRHADRRIELLQVGRTGMDKMSREIRKAYDIYSSNNPSYIDFYPDWATNTAMAWATGSVFRFNYDGASQLEFGTQSATLDSLMAPVDEFEYTTYDRRQNESVARSRQVNSFKFRFEVSDERQILPTAAALNLNPMQFRSQVQMRVSREGYMISRTLGFASETYQFKRSTNDPICVMAFCDRIDPSITVQQRLKTKPVAAGAVKNFNFNYIAAGDYFSVCIHVADLSGGLPVLGQYKFTTSLRDNTQESCEVQDSFWLIN
jgi:type II secretory pathway pseudopilin PulG